MEWCVSVCGKGGVVERVEERRRVKFWGFYCARTMWIP